MSQTIVEIPEWPGGSCINARCPGSGKQRILSIEEVKHVYPIKDKFDWWPVPEGTTHVCTVCGFCYEGVSESYQERQHPTGPVQVELPMDEWDWTFEDQFDQTVREAVEEFVRAAPDDVTSDEIAIGVGRYVAGVDDEFARDVMMAMDDYDEPVRTIDEFM